VLSVGIVITSPSMKFAPSVEYWSLTYLLEVGCAALPRYQISWEPVVLTLNWTPAVLLPVPCAGKS